MNLLSYMLNFPDERECKRLFRASRADRGLVCRRCGFDDFYWLSTIDQFKCKECGTRITLKSGTVLENSKLPYRYWLLAIYLIHIENKSFSALTLQRQLGHKRYQPISDMLTKIKNMNASENEDLIKTLERIDIEYLINIRHN